MTYDLIVVGGGIAGASLARRMSASGARVAVVEREMKFRDRIRGESLAPWGVAEARRLGIAEAVSTCSSELRWFEQSMNGDRPVRRDLRATTLQQEPMWGFYHPQAQEIILAQAASAGTEVRRGAAVQQATGGGNPTVRIETNGQVDQLAARLVVLCTGRNCKLRADLGFRLQRGSIPLLLSGVLLTDLPSEVDPAVAYIANDVEQGAIAGLFPQPGGRARAYFGFHPQTCPRLQGDADFLRFKQLFTAAARKMIPLGETTQAGPLASFECRDVWVQHPYRDGVALVGDAAACSDPSWGQGLALSLRDARVLSDELLGDNDWDTAAHRYAERHDQHYDVVRTTTGWFYDIFQRLGPEADARRARALPLIGQDPTRVPDVLFSGPEFPLHENARLRFFGEDVQA